MANYNVIDITGKVYGRLTVISLAGRAKDRSTMWLCRCECGTEKAINKSALQKGVTVSCGCRMLETLHEQHSVQTTHGKARSRVYNCWLNMIVRCSNCTHKEFDNYGGRGISVCERWRSSFENFLADMGEPSRGESIDRINNNGNYEPGNCRWATCTQQARNKTTSRLIEIDGVSKTVVEWSEISGVNSRTITARLNSGIPAREAVFSKKLKCGPKGPTGPRKKRDSNVSV